MMRILIFVVVVLAAATLTVQAAVVYTEDFESGVDGWASTNPSLSPAVTNNYPRPADNSVWSLWIGSGSGTQFYHTWTNGVINNWYVTWKVYDHGANMNFCQMISPRLTAPGILEWLGLGVYNGSADYYSFGYGSAGTSGWTATSIARTRMAWHTMGIGVDSSGVASFYIDGQLAGSRSTANTYGYMGIYLGSDVSGITGHGCYDDINIGTGAIPEPASLLAVASGLVGLAGWRRRTRKV